MIFIYISMVILVCLSSGNSLESTENQSPSKERYSFFDAEVFQVFNQKKNENVLISPISIKLVLGMLLEGAEDATAEEIRVALRLPEDEERKRMEFAGWLSALQMKDPVNVLKIANRMFLSSRHSVNTVYEKTISKYYSGGVTSVKFEDAKETCRVINGWVGNQTSQLIPSLVEENQISPDNELMLASAVYFRGFWSNPFASERSTLRCFYPKDNKCKDSLVMVETGYFEYGYINRLDAKAIVLPYKGEKFSMLLLLPSKRNGVDLLVRDLSHVSLLSVLSELKKQEVFVQIPQFEISHSNDLVESLKSVRISEAFTQKANLSRMFTDRLHTRSVRHIYHSAKITVNEKGSEAAAATGALFVPLMGGTTTSFVADHPFLFFVMGSAKNLILFAGKLIIPEDSKKGVFSLKNPTSKKDVWPGNSSRKSDAASSDEVRRKSESSDKNSRQRLLGPKFRSTKPLQSGEERKSELENLPFHRTLVSHPDVFFEKETFKKKGKIFQEPGKNRKRQEPPTDDWRHHVLFFT